VADYSPGQPVTLMPRVTRVLCDNPSVFTGRGTNTYLIGTDRVAVIDPGPDDAGHIETVAAAGAGRIRWILVTHTHPDHSPGAARLADLTGAEVLGYEARDAFEPDTSIGDGWRLAGDDFQLTALHTPGHASNHLCYLLEGERALFSGDHVMNGSTVIISPPDGDMAAYLQALQRLEALRPPVLSIAPGHGDLIDDPMAKFEEYRTHRHAREEAVFAALAAAGRATVEELVPAVYVDVPEDRHAIARYSLWAHLRKLAQEGRVESSDVDDLGSTWRPVAAAPGAAG